jgi:hypothetical protein
MKKETNSSEEEPFYKWCYGKFVIAGTIPKEDKKPSTN